MERALSAPSKLFLAGEYAVLWGGTARIAAIGPRSSALVRRRDDREVHLVLEEGRLVGQATPVGVRWSSEVPAGFSFVARAVDLVWRAHGRESLGFDLALAPSPGAPDGRKLGLGGSARAAMLATEAARFILEERFDALKLALLAHAEVQGMKGSGGDVAAIFAGGVVRYRRYPVEPLAGALSSGQLSAALGKAEPVDLWRLPAPKVSLAYAFAGESASTSSLIRSVESRLDASARADFVRESDTLASQLEDALTRGQFQPLATAAEALHALLCTLGPLESAPMRQLLALAKSHGATGKISGAGGGDGCILFAPDDAAREALLDALKSRGFFAFPLSLEPGLRGESMPDPRLRTWLGR